MIQTQHASECTATWPQARTNLATGYGEPKGSTLAVTAPRERSGVAQRDSYETTRLRREADTNGAWAVCSALFSGVTGILAGTSFFSAAPEAQAWAIELLSLAVSAVVLTFQWGRRAIQLESEIELRKP